MYVTVRICYLAQVNNYSVKMSLISYNLAVFEKGFVCKNPIPRGVESSSETNQRHRACLIRVYIYAPSFIEYRFLTR